MTIEETIDPIIEKAYEVKQDYDNQIRSIGMFNPDDIIGQHTEKVEILKKTGMLDLRKYYKRSLIVSERVASILSKFAGNGFRKTMTMIIPYLSVYYMTHDSYLTSVAIIIAGGGIYVGEKLIECTSHKLIEEPTERLKKKAQYLDLLIDRLENKD